MECVTCGVLRVQFLFAGWNIWEIMEGASDAPAPFRYLNRDGREMIKKMMNKGVESGLTVVRKAQRSCFELCMYSRLQYLDSAITFLNRIAVIQT